MANLDADPNKGILSKIQKNVTARADLVLVGDPVLERPIITDHRVDSDRDPLGNSRSLDFQIADVRVIVATVEPRDLITQWRELNELMQSIVDIKPRYSNLYGYDSSFTQRPAEIKIGNLGFKEYVGRRVQKTASTLIPDDPAMMEGLPWKVSPNATFEEEGVLWRMVILELFPNQSIARLMADYQMDYKNHDLVPEQDSTPMELLACRLLNWHQARLEDLAAINNPQYHVEEVEEKDISGRVKTLKRYVLDVPRVPIPAYPSTEY